jgi:hypothetical protein
MLMMCWFYCIPFVELLFYAIAPMCVLAAVFMLKRGFRKSSPALRFSGVVFLTMAAFKVFIVDLRLLKKWILCGSPLDFLPCSAQGGKILDAVGFFAMMVSAFGLFLLFQKVMRNVPPPPPVTAEQNGLRFWANSAFTFVMILIVWTTVPWIGVLTTGHVPEIFLKIAWQPIGILCVVFLLTGFWKLEDCNWTYSSKDRKAGSVYANKVWTPRDTLWTSVWLFLFTASMSYVTHDILWPK